MPVKNKIIRYSTKLFRDLAELLVLLLRHYVEHSLQPLLMVRKYLLMERDGIYYVLHEMSLPMMIYIVGSPAAVKQIRVLCLKP